MARTVPVLRSSSHSERYTTQARSLQRVRRLGPPSPFRTLLHSEQCIFAGRPTLDRMSSAILLRAAASPNEAGNRIGFLNRIFNYLYAVRRVGKRLKAWHRPTYYIFKWILFGAIMVRLFATL